MAVTVTLTFDTVDDMLASLTRNNVSLAPYSPSVPCCLGPDDGREPFTTPIPIPVAAAPARTATIDILVGLLQDPKFTIRSMSTLMDNSGLMEPADVYDLLDKHGFEYVTKTRRRDGEAMVGLLERN